MEDRGPQAVEFGKRVRKRRDDLGWSQETLAHRSGLAPVQISRIERGTREPRLATILCLVDALDVEPNDLLGSLPPMR